MRAPVFTQTSEGLYISDFPEEIELAPELLAHPLHPYLEVMVTFRCANGRATYKIDGRQGPHFRLHRISGGLFFPGPEEKGP